VKRFAPAKINLFLHVGDRRTDGYHDLLSLVVFADCGDMIRVTPRKGAALEVTGPASAGLDASPSNLVLLAEAALRQWAEANGHEAPPVSIHLDKHLPLASGVGGGSADAAATLHALAEHWSLPIALDDLLAVGRAIGADVPVCLRGMPTLVSGDGDRLAPVPDLPGFALVLVNPRVEVPTAKVFGNLDVRTGAYPQPFPAQMDSLRGFVAWLDRTSNDLASPAKQIAPQVMHVEHALTASTGCLLARMSGSGATCFGIYPTIEAANTAAREIAAANPAWWVKPAGLYQ
jgi:4-diphosphocytidyl-2-C-methyl-D-erythritol kinase